MPQPTALITGMCGQDGILLARHLSSLNYRVVGTVLPHQTAMHTIYCPSATAVVLDVTDTKALNRLLIDLQPDEIYHLAARSSVRESWNDPIGVTEVNALAPLHLLDCVRNERDKTGWNPVIVQASSSEMFGLAETLPQRITSPHHPRSPYASAKSFAFHTTVNYRESFGLKCVNAVMFNHESALRPQAFVTRRISHGAAEISLGRRQNLTLGTLDVRRDWGSAHDYVQALHVIATSPELRDYVVATGVSRSLTDFVGTAMTMAGIEDWKDRVVSDPTRARPAEVFETRGDANPIAHDLGWTPTTSFDRIIERMLDVDRERLITGIEHHPSYALSP